MNGKDAMELTDKLFRDFRDHMGPLGYILDDATINFDKKTARLKVDLSGIVNNTDDGGETGGN